jgi:hypothetical protein
VLTPLALPLIRFQFIIDGVLDVSISAVLYNLMTRAEARFKVGRDADIESVGRNVGIPDDVDASLGWK